MGFCLLANVALAAMHAKASFGLKRIAIVDYDVHHGELTDTDTSIRIDISTRKGSEALADRHWCRAHFQRKGTVAFTMQHLSWYLERHAAFCSCSC